jgi:hypothetical protein
MAPNKDLVSFTVQDLTLLMDAYKNNVELSTTLLGQLKRVADAQEDLNETMQDVSSNLNKMSDNLGKMNEHLIKVQEKIMDVQSEAIKEHSIVKVDLDKNYASLRNMIWGSYVGMITIITTFIILANNLFDKYKVINEIAPIIKAVGLKLGIRIGG